MTFVFGAKTIQRECPPEQKVCPSCLSVTEHTVIEHDTWLTFYFIPLFSIKREVVYTCTQCADTYTIPYREYQAAQPKAAPMPEETTPLNRNSGPSPKAKASRKGRVILEGKVVGGEVKTYLPLSARFSSEQILKWLWLAFALIALVAIILIIVLFTLLTR